MLLLFISGARLVTSIVDRPGSADIVQRPGHPDDPTVRPPGNGVLVQRPDAATVEVTAWNR